LVFTKTTLKCYILVHYTTSKYNILYNIMSPKIRKSISFPPELITLIERKAGRLGFDLQEYVRMVLAQDVQDELKNTPPSAQKPAMPTPVKKDIPLSCS